MITVEQVLTFTGAIFLLFMLVLAVLAVSLAFGGWLCGLFSEIKHDRRNGNTRAAKRNRNREETK